MPGRTSRRLSELGIELPPAPKPVAAYVPAVRYGDLVQSAGQIPFVAGALHAAGTVGVASGPGVVSPEVGIECARICTLNALAAAASVVRSVDDITSIIKATVYVASEPGFTGQSVVADGCSDLLGDVFGPDGPHARVAVGVAALPLGAPVEVELLVSVR